jgi:hypothetical protein
MPTKFSQTASSATSTINAVKYRATQEYKAPSPTCENVQAIGGDCYGLRGEADHLLQGAW